MVFGSSVLTYNGELYNHERLRATMPGPWKSTGDTEVLLHLLAQRGAHALSSLAGMFAFALWDSATRRLLLARDRLGIKPLYYRLLPDGIAFASELKALMLLGKPEIDKGALRDSCFTATFRHRKPSTRHRKLPAGHTLTFADGRTSVQRYWDPSAAIVARDSAPRYRSSTRCCAK